MRLRLPSEQKLALLVHIFGASVRAFGEHRGSGGFAGGAPLREPGLGTLGGMGARSGRVGILGRGRFIGALRALAGGSTGFFGGGFAWERG